MSTSSDQKPSTIAEVVGRFVRRFRADHRISRDALAQAGSALGMTWGTTSIENIEAGRFAPTLPTLFALCAAMSAASPQGQRVALPDLFDEVDRVAITDDFNVSTSRLLAFFGTEEVLPVGDWIDEYTRSLNTPVRRAAPTLAERRAAKKLEVSTDALRDAAWHLWSDTLEGVVSKSVGRDASAQARGHETRFRVSELREYMTERGSDG